MNIFYIILHQPLFNALIFIYNTFAFKDIGLAIIILTIIIKFIIYPLNTQAIKSQKKLTQLAPQIKEIQEKYKNDKAAQGKATMELYQKQGINPFGGCLPLLIQLPILIALFRVFLAGFEPETMQGLYSFVQNPGQINTLFLGFIDLASPFWLIAVLAGVLQFLQVKMTTPSVPKKQKDMASLMQKQMQYFFPAFTITILFQLSSAIGLYWIITTVFTILQQKIIFKKNGGN
ncbi:MAG: YidC/Oxa1 family membrane protein insertase [Candidatus Pacebacteria bacterium]|nr:YidC/Oxa1 family membrane protein insertase [Candidatus Paceibacterota bacterium]